MKISCLAFLMVLCFILPIFSSLVPSEETVVDAVANMLVAGYVKMSISFRFIHQNQTPETYQAITVFAPSDNAFNESGKPSISLLRYQIAKERLTMDKLKSLPFGTKIPTLFENHSLIVTSTYFNQDVSLNNVTIDASVIFDVGTMVVYGMSKFFDPSFAISSVSTPLVQNPSENLGCVAAPLYDKLIESQYSVMHSFLDLFLESGLRDQTKLTIFAPDDDELRNRLANFTDFGSIFGRHVVPRKLTWNDLVNLEEGTELPTFLKGFNLKITRSGDVLVLNGVRIIFPEAYSAEDVVFHGIEKLLELNGQHGLKGDFVSRKMLLFHSKTAVPVLDYVLRALQAGRRTIYFSGLQLLLIGSGIYLYPGFIQNPQRFLIPEVNEVYLGSIINILEALSISFEEKGGFSQRFLTLPITFLQLYFILVKAYYHGHHNRTYTLLDACLFCLTTEWTIFLRLSELVGEPIPQWMIAVGPYLSLTSVCIHMVDFYFWRFIRGHQVAA